mmetsp:Transcript_15994/g.64537  ORF Transcript_15994/g.64537 Transcript_15994/m.64537 type:complete len:261 (-) Transcript_15994:47-829(-)
MTAYVSARFSRSVPSGRPSRTPAASCRGRTSARLARRSSADMRAYARASPSAVSSMPSGVPIATRDGCEWWTNSRKSPGSPLPLARRHSRRRMTSIDFGAASGAASDSDESSSSSSDAAASSSSSSDEASSSSSASSPPSSSSPGVSSPGASPPGASSPSSLSPPSSSARSSVSDARCSSSSSAASPRDGVSRVSRGGASSSTARGGVPRGAPSSSFVGGGADTPELLDGCGPESSAAGLVFGPTTFAGFFAALGAPGRT